MSCHPKPSPGSDKVWLYYLLPIDISLDILRFIHGLLHFFNGGTFSMFSPSIFRLSTNTVLPRITYTTSLSRFVSFFQFFYAVHQSPAFT